MDLVQISGGAVQPGPLVDPSWLVIPSNPQRLWFSVMSYPVGVSNLRVQLGRDFPPVLNPGEIALSQSWRFFSTTGDFAETFHFNDYGPMVQGTIYAISSPPIEVYWTEGHTPCDDFTSTRWGPVGCPLGFRMWRYRTSLAGEPLEVLNSNSKRILFGHGRQDVIQGYYSLSGSSNVNDQLLRFDSNVRSVYRYPDLGPIVQQPIYFMPTVPFAASGAIYEVFIL